MRCVECGETWWSALIAANAGACEHCGGELVEERRFPGRAAAPPETERRDAPALADSAS
jgi:hypothetical protein